jgi:hypothetical protein
MAEHLLVVRSWLLIAMTLTAIGSYGFLTRAHLQHHIAAREMVDRDAEPIAQRIALTQATVADLDGQIARLDAVVKTATARGWTKTAMALVGRQSPSRTTLVAERQQAAGVWPISRCSRPMWMHSAPA